MAFVLGSISGRAIVREDNVRGRSNFLPSVCHAKKDRSSEDTFDDMTAVCNTVSIVHKEQ